MLWRHICPIRKNYKGAVINSTMYKDITVDIGANYTRHATRGRFNIHCCTPIIDIRDSTRETSRSEILRHAADSGKLTTKMCRAYLSKEGSAERCYQRGEHCTSKAKYAMMVHSQYDVDIATLGRMLDAHEPVQLISVMNFVPFILYAQRRMVKDGHELV